MPQDVFTDPNNVLQTGLVTIAQDPSTGLPGQLNMVASNVVGLPAAAAIVTLSATSGLITMTGLGSKIRTIVTGNGTGISATLTPSATASVTNGAEVTIINENPVSASSLIITAGVTGNVTILGAAARKFIYDAALTIWVAA